MTETKFTPGPWRSTKYEMHVVAGDNGICKFESKHGFYDNYTANVHLIAAAPELYEALDAVKAYFEGKNSDQVADDTYNTVLAAQAKARGEQP